MMPHRKQSVWIISIVTLAVVVVASLIFGGSVLNWDDLTLGFTNHLGGAATTESASMAWTILTELRIPRALTAALVGSALAVAGVLAQGLFRENLASPTVLGTEAGGSIAAAIAFMLGWAHENPLLLPLAAFAGAIATTLMALGIAKRSQSQDSITSSTTHIMLSGFAINALLGAGTSYLITMTLEEPGRSGRALSFLIGGLAAKGYEHVIIAGVTLSMGLIAGLKVAAALDVLGLGEDTAQSLSIDLQRLRRHTIAVIGILVAGAVAAAGALPFVGLIVPHIARRLIGASHRGLVALAAVQGATLVVAADLAARWLRAPIELPASILTSALGATFFLLLLARPSKGGSE
ncbi:MAG: iron ABC transporter permease [Deltaproteobacteria bacterium]|nr:iron ABC transporter permease [Deltaproteobacteria bacterium]